MEIKKQIEEHIDWCIAVGILPWDYRESTDYSTLIGGLGDE